MFKQKLSDCVRANLEFTYASQMNSLVSVECSMCPYRQKRYLYSEDVTGTVYYKPCATESDKRVEII
jgi:hypothetical protein